MPVTLTLNGKPTTVDADPQMPLLWVIRERAGLTGTKFGCGIAACGACTVHVNGAPVRSCVYPISAVEGAKVTTIEGLAQTIGLPEGEHPVQKAWIVAQVPQCGYCQSGMIMAACGLLAQKPAPTDADIDGAMTNICRCGTYPRVRQAIHDAAKTMPAAKGRS
ncbi:MAG TPA: (2Fe-2S)-binding protein [Ramlibacter sp.]|nr:(2Fe-2S)-binding protein [Ramlibacter sp.]